MTETVNEQKAWFPEVSVASYTISVSPNGNVPTPAWSHSDQSNPEHVKLIEATPALSVNVGGRQLCDPCVDRPTGIVTSSGQPTIFGSSWSGAVKEVKSELIT